MKKLGVLIPLFTLILVATAFGFIQNSFNLQGELKNSRGEVLTGIYTTVFTIYDAAGTQQWTETHNIRTSNGIFDVQLGNTTPIILPFDEEYHLGIKVGSDSEMTPRINLTSIPWAYSARYCDMLNGYNASNISALVGNTTTELLAELDQYWVNYSGTAQEIDSYLNISNFQLINGTNVNATRINVTNITSFGYVTIGTTDPLDELTIVGGVDIMHTSVELGEHALEIDMNASGFGDSKGIDIVYTTGAIDTGQDEEVILINLDESLATGGDVFGLEMLTTEGSANIYGMKVGALIGPIHQDSGVFANMDSASNNGVDNLAEFISSASDVTIFANDNDYVVIGDAAKFEEIEFLLDTPASNPGIKPTFEYSIGVGTWGTFTPTDGTNGMRNTGVLSWEDDDIPTWVAGAGSEYLIRINRTQNNLVTTPKEDKVQIAAVTEYYWDENAYLLINNMTATDIYSTNITLGGYQVCTSVSGGCAKANGNSTADWRVEFDPIYIENDETNTTAEWIQEFDSLWVNLTGEGQAITGLINLTNVTVLAFDERGNDEDKNISDGAVWFNRSIPCFMYEDGTGKKCINEPNNFSYPLPISGVVEGVYASKLSSLDYEVSDGIYYIRGIRYTLPDSLTVSLSAANETYNRFDVLYVNTTRDVGVLTGEPSVNPQKPSLDSSQQIEVPGGFILVLSTGGTQQPDATENETIYDENASGEWVGQDYSGAIQFNGTADPQKGTIHIYTLAGETFDVDEEFEFNRSSQLSNVSSFKKVTFYFNVTSWPENKFHIDVWLEDSAGNQIGGVGIIEWPDPEADGYVLKTLSQDDFSPFPTDPVDINTIKFLGAKGGGKPPSGISFKMDAIDIEWGGSNATPGGGLEPHSLDPADGYQTGTLPSDYITWRTTLVCSLGDALCNISTADNRIGELYANYTNVSDVIAKNLNATYINSTNITLGGDQVCTKSSGGCGTGGGNSTAELLAELDSLFINISGEGQYLQTLINFSSDAIFEANINGTDTYMTNVNATRVNATEGKFYGDVDVDGLATVTNLTISNTNDEQELLCFNTDRPFCFRTTGSDAQAKLIFQSKFNKLLNFTDSNDASNFWFSFNSDPSLANFNSQGSISAQEISKAPNVNATRVNVSNIQVTKKFGINLTNTGGGIIQATAGALALRSPATKNLNLDAGGFFQFRDEDASRAIRAFIDSSNGNMSIDKDFVAGGSLGLNGTSNLIFYNGSGICISAC
jgi:hypothetical protein